MRLFFKTFGYSLITKQTRVAELIMLGQFWHQREPTFIQRLVLLGNQRNSFTLVNVNLTITCII